MSFTFLLCSLMVDFTVGLAVGLFSSTPQSSWILRIQWIIFSNPGSGTNKIRKSKRWSSVMTISRHSIYLYDRFNDCIVLIMTLYWLGSTNGFVLPPPTPRPIVISLFIACTRLFGIRSTGKGATFGISKWLEGKPLSFNTQDKLKEKYLLYAVEVRAFV